MSPKYSLEDFIDEFKESTLTPDQIDELYYGKPEESKLKEKLKSCWVSDWEY